MNKRETIDRIVARNPSAKPEFLAEFTPQELRDYLQQLESLDGSPPQTVPAELVEQLRM